MIWVVLGFDRNSDSLVVEQELPASFTADDAARLVGPHPDLIGSSFPLAESQLAAVSALLDVRADPDRIAYFLEAQDDAWGVH
ncbi:hypothetical protein K353_06616 [Kitasatospora sp. SolWspMP-SS2h]|uniref:DUF7683 domain-containing protein n=1 Tax=Kitasatospora sp. SolWspMP-SS2h TaxID=1305729 RepID=UPI000DB9071A|nr:hypothetical protein [Kitasatospora sp. SolWspMP-SS2h]RAJ29634.1 hypothetical protein K353_06616 [Kitasatospora sp. SolWspMP-SS2h]